MDGVRQWAGQALQDAGQILQFVFFRVLAWWGALPPFHATVGIFSILVVLVTDYLYNAGMQEWAPPAPAARPLPAVRRGVVVANLVFVAVVLMPIVFFFSMFVVGGKDASGIAGDMFAIWVLIYARIGMNILTGVLPRNRFLRFLGRVVVLGLGGMAVVALMAPILLPR